MPDLTHCLHLQDIGFLNIIAELWGLDVDAPDARSTLTPLIAGMHDRFLFEEMVAALPRSASQALLTLKANNGRMPWPHFTRDFGELRSMGAAKRDREKPHRSPISATETLWYRAMIGRDFLEHAGTLQECAYIPDEFIAWLPATKIQTSASVTGEPASLTETDIIHPASDQILDATCTLLAAQRRSQPSLLPGSNDWILPKDHLLSLVKSLSLINKDGLPDADYARPFLEANRRNALLFLVEGWIKSETFNELRLVPSLKCEGAWQNKPRKVRAAILDLIRQVPAGQWWSLEAFIKDIHQAFPDFQRSAGEYDTWLIRSAETSGLLLGLSNWDDVEGALIRYLISEPMHALGLLDLATTQNGTSVIAFRTAAWFEKLMAGQPPDDLENEMSPVLISSSGLIEMSNTTARIVRYQVSRFCEWVSEQDGQYRYRLTPQSLKSAREQGLKTSHLISLLRKYGKSAPPPSLVNAIKRWEEAGREAFIEPLCVLRVASPEILAALRESPANRFLGEPLGPVSIIVHENAIDKVLSALARQGYLADVQK